MEHGRRWGQRLFSNYFCWAEARSQDGLGIGLARYYCDSRVRRYHQLPRALGRGMEVEWSGCAIGKFFVTTGVLAHIRKC